jgi:hypothetical protein
MMWQHGLRSVGLGLVMCAFAAALAGGHTASAQTVGVPVQLTNTAGTTIGTVTAVRTGGVIQASVSLYGLQPGGSYTLCLTDPTSQQLTTACTPPVPVVNPCNIYGCFAPVCPVIGCIAVNCGAFGCPTIATSSGTQLSIVADATGGGHWTISAPSIATVALVVLWNNVSPLDNAQVFVPVS